MVSGKMKNFLIDLEDVCEESYSVRLSMANTPHKRLADYGECDIYMYLQTNEDKLNAHVFEEIEKANERFKKQKAKGKREDRPFKVIVPLSGKGGSELYIRRIHSEEKMSINFLIELTDRLLDYLDGEMNVNMEDDISENYYHDYDEEDVGYGHSKNKHHDAFNFEDEDSSEHHLNSFKFNEEESRDSNKNFDNNEDDFDEYGDMNKYSGHKKHTLQVDSEDNEDYENDYYGQNHEDEDDNYYSKQNQGQIQNQDNLEDEDEDDFDDADEINAYFNSLKEQDVNNEEDNYNNSVGFDELNDEQDQENFDNSHKNTFDFDEDDDEEDDEQDQDENDIFNQSIMTSTNSTDSINLKDEESSDDVLANFLNQNYYQNNEEEQDQNEDESGDSGFDYPFLSEDDLDEHGENNSTVVQNQDQNDDYNNRNQDHEVEQKQSTTSDDFGLNYFDNNNEISSNKFTSNLDDDFDKKVNSIQNNISSEKVEDDLQKIHNRINKENTEMVESKITIPLSDPDGGFEDDEEDDDDEAFWNQGKN